VRVLFILVVLNCSKKMFVLVFSWFLFPDDFVDLHLDYLERHKFLHFCHKNQFMMLLDKFTILVYRLQNAKKSVRILSWNVGGIIFLLVFVILPHDLVLLYLCLSNFVFSFAWRIFNIILTSSYKQNPTPVKTPTTSIYIILNVK